MEGTGPARPFHRVSDAPDTRGGGGVHLVEVRGGLGLGSCRASRVARPAPALTQHPRCPQGAEALGASPCPPRYPCPARLGPSARANPTYRARPPSRHRQRAPAASLRLGTLPASRALAAGHVTDGRRAPVRVRTPAGPALASAA